MALLESVGANAGSFIKLPGLHYSFTVCLLYLAQNKPLNAIVVIYSIMVKVGHTVHCHIWYH